jgi:hypothetical protein
LCIQTCLAAVMNCCVILKLRWNPFHAQLRIRSSCLGKFRIHSAPTSWGQLTSSPLILYWRSHSLHKYNQLHFLHTNV